MEHTDMYDHINCEEFKIYWSHFYNFCRELDLNGGKWNSKTDKVLKILKLKFWKIYLDQAVTVLEATKFFENRAQAQEKVKTPIIRNISYESYDSYHIADIISLMIDSYDKKHMICCISYVILICIWFAQHAMDQAMAILFISYGPYIKMPIWYGSYLVRLPLTWNPK